MQWLDKESKQLFKPLRQNRHKSQDTSAGDCRVKFGLLSHVIEAEHREQRPIFHDNARGVPWRRKHNRAAHQTATSRVGMVGWILCSTWRALWVLNRVNSANFLIDLSLEYLHLIIPPPYSLSLSYQDLRFQLRQALIYSNFICFLWLIVKMHINYRLNAGDESGLTGAVLVKTPKSH